MTFTFYDDTRKDRVLKFKKKLKYQINHFQTLIMICLQDEYSAYDKGSLVKILYMLVKLKELYVNDNAYLNLTCMEELLVFRYVISNDKLDEWTSDGFNFVLKLIEYLSFNNYLYDINYSIDEILKPEYLSESI